MSITKEGRFFWGHPTRHIPYRRGQMEWADGGDLHRVPVPTASRCNSFTHISTSFQHLDVNQTQFTVFSIIFFHSRWKDENHMFKSLSLLPSLLLPSLLLSFNKSTRKLMKERLTPPLPTQPAPCGLHLPAPQSPRTARSTRRRRWQLRGRPLRGADGRPARPGVVFKAKAWCSETVWFPPVLDSS